jgi:predicted nucleic acid-binding protein
VYARLSNLRLSNGTAKNLDANDRWIASCAIRHGVPLLSNNRLLFAVWQDVLMGRLNLGSCVH